MAAEAGAIDGLGQGLGVGALRAGVRDKDVGHRSAWQDEDGTAHRERDGLGCNLVLGTDDGAETEERACDGDAGVRDGSARPWAHPSLASPLRKSLRSDL